MWIKIACYAMRAENMLYNNRTQCYGKVYFPELLTLFPVSHLAFNAVQFHCTPFDIIEQYSEKCTENAMGSS